MEKITEAELIEIRRDFHRHPELSEQETRTMEKICEYLSQWGIEHEKGAAGTGVVAVIRGGRPGKTVGIRGDMDALPIEEVNTTLPYCSQNPGVMHACGHDAHVTIVLGVAKTLKQMEKELAGNVKFFFQPAEETVGGARRMIEAGCLENPRVDCVLGIHVNPLMETGTAGIKYGKMYAASDMLSLRVFGKSSHGAHPDEGVDAILAAAGILNALQTVASRNVSPVNSVVVSIGTIHGGRIRNQIADCVELEGIIRTLDPSTRIYARERVRAVCEHTAEALGARVELTLAEGYSPLINDDAITDTVLSNAKGLLGEAKVILEDVPEMGTEDFSYFAAARPSCFFHLGCTAGEKLETAADLHNSGFDIDERCLQLGVDLQVKNILSLLEK